MTSSPLPGMFDKILIANRGEIACRVMRTCRRLGVRTVAVFSDADASSLHVRSADEAVHLGGSPAKESYLDGGKVIAAALRTGAATIHPGYGFLSENADFAEACAAAGITFIGPPASAIRAMGSKSAAKALMQRAGVPLTPGYHGENQSPDFLHQQANAIGYPVLIKASAGGGGKGMRRVDSSGEFSASLASCQREAVAAFSDARVLVEKYILSPRHIEIQVFADASGATLSLFERDCSVQRRHQKVLEEAPAPGMTEERRSAMSKAACDAARAVGYVGAGTVEFIADAAGSFHFMEMNTRLQVEHPVTEMITGLDLVEWQLRIAAGEPLPLTESQLQIHGHAIEARIYAEDPAHGFLPSTGKLVHFKTPDPSNHIRIDSGVEAGDAITAFYDPMIAKLIAWDSSRELALGRLGRALSEFQIAGVTTNIAFLKRLVESPSFVSANLDTALIEREGNWLLAGASRPPEEALLLAALASLLEERRQASAEGYTPWNIRDGWRLAGTLRRTLNFANEDRTNSVTVKYIGNDYSMRIGGTDFAVSGEIGSDGEITAMINGIRTHATVIASGGAWHVFFDGRSFVYRPEDSLAFDSADGAQEASLLAPMPCLLTAVFVAAGDAVEKGTPLLVLEAMKMEYTVVAPAAGVVKSVLFASGDRVTEGTQLVQFEPSPEGGK